MKIDLYFWPINTQAWVLSWGLLRTMRSMGVLNWWGRMEKWTKPDQVKLMMTTSADIILFVGFEQFEGKINLNHIKSNKFVCWTYESLTDPYGALEWNKLHPNHALAKYKDFNTGYTKYNDKRLAKHFENIKYVFCADELDCTRFEAIDKRTSWLPFGIDASVFANAAVPIQKPTKIEMVTSVTRPKRGGLRKVYRYGVKSGKADADERIVRIGKAGPRQGGRISAGCFVGAKSNVRVNLLNRLGLDLAATQTKRKGDFGNEEIALQHTQELVSAYNAYSMSFNLRSIFSGITPRAAESMACGCLLFQYKPPPNRPKSNALYKNCIMYEALTNAGLARVREQYHHYKGRPSDALEIGKAARQEILASHTLQHRVQKMIEAIRGK